MFTTKGSRYTWGLFRISAFIFISMTAYNSYASVCFLPTGNCVGEDVTLDTTGGWDVWPGFCPDEYPLGGEPEGKKCTESKTDAGCYKNDCECDKENGWSSTKPATGNYIESNGCYKLKSENEKEEEEQTSECQSQGLYDTKDACSSANGGADCKQDSEGCWTVRTSSDSGCAGYNVAKSTIEALQTAYGVSSFDTFMANLSKYTLEKCEACPTDDTKYKCKYVGCPTGKTLYVSSDVKNNSEMKTALSSTQINDYVEMIDQENIDAYVTGRGEATGYMSSFCLGEIKSYLASEEYYEHIHFYSDTCESYVDGFKIGDTKTFPSGGIATHIKTKNFYQGPNEGLKTAYRVGCGVNVSCPELIKTPDGTIRETGTRITINNYDQDYCLYSYANGGGACGFNVTTQECFGMCLKQALSHDSYYNIKGTQQHYLTASYIPLSNNEPNIIIPRDGCSLDGTGCTMFVLDVTASTKQAICVDDSNENIKSDVVVTNAKLTHHVTLASKINVITPELFVNPDVVPNGNFTCENMEGTLVSRDTLYEFWEEKFSYDPMDDFGECEDTGNEYVCKLGDETYFYPKEETFEGFVENLSRYTLEECTKCTDTNGDTQYKCKYAGCPDGKDLYIKHDQDIDILEEYKTYFTKTKITDDENIKYFRAFGDINSGYYDDNSITLIDEGPLKTTNCDVCFYTARDYGVFDFEEYRYNNCNVRDSIDVSSETEGFVREIYDGRRDCSGANCNYCSRWIECKASLNGDGVYEDYLVIDPIRSIDVYNMRDPLDHYLGLAEERICQIENYSVENKDKKALTEDFLYTHIYPDGVYRYVYDVNIKYLEADTVAVCNTSYCDFWSANKNVFSPGESCYHVVCAKPEVYTHSETIMTETEKGVSEIIEDKPIILVPPKELWEEYKWK